MFKSSVFLSVVIAFFLQTLPASAQVRFSEEAIENLRNYETGRAKACIERAISPNTSEENYFPVEIVKDKWPRYIHNEITGSLPCPVDYSVTYLVPQVEKSCQDDTELVVPICHKFDEFKENPKGNTRFLFSQDLETLLERNEYFPWQVIESQNGPADLIGILLMQRGNVLIKVTLFLTPVHQEALKGSFGKKIKSRMKKLGLDLVDEEFLYFPYLRFDFSTQGIGQKQYYFEISRVGESKNGKEKETPFYGNTLKNNQALSHYIVFLKIAEEDFIKAPYLIFRAFTSNKKRGDPLVEIKIDNREFEAIWKQLLDHYQGESASGS